jgi:hypothetical protein
MLRVDRTTHRTDERGTAMVSAVILAIVAASMSAAMMATVTSRASLTRQSRDGMLAIEQVDNGLSLSRAELQSEKDLDGDGVKGTTKGNMAGADFVVASTKMDTTHYRLVGTATFGSQKRTVESVVEVTQSVTNPFQYAAFGEDWVVFNGGSKGDAFDSDAGPYAFQAVNTDKWGNMIAQSDCDIGSNGPITISGTGSVVNGDACAGPTDSTILNGGGQVDGSTAPLLEEAKMPGVDVSQVYDENGTVKPALKNYSSWLKVGNATVDAIGNIDVKNGGVLTIPEGTYYVNSIKLTNASKIVTVGKVTLFLGHKCDATGGTFVNTSQIASNLMIMGLGDESLSGSDNIQVNSQMGFFGAIYAPKMGVTISGGGSYYGSVVGLTVKDTGGSAFHFDLALKEVSAPVLGPVAVKQISWRRVSNELAPK